MLYREIIAVCSQIHTKHITTLCGQNVESVLLLNLTVHKVKFQVKVYGRNATNVQTEGCVKIYLIAVTRT
jgi:hypothetical protein